MGLNRWPPQQAGSRRLLPAELRSIINYFLSMVRKTGFRTRPLNLKPKWPTKLELPWGFKWKGPRGVELNLIQSNCLIPTGSCSGANYGLAEDLGIWTPGTDMPLQIFGSCAPGQFCHLHYITFSLLGAKDRLNHDHLGHDVLPWTTQGWMQAGGAEPTPWGADLLSAANSTPAKHW